MVLFLSRFLGVTVTNLGMLRVLTKIDGLLGLKVQQIGLTLVKDIRDRC